MVGKERRRVIEGRKMGFSILMRYIMALYKIQQRYDSRLKQASYLTDLILKRDKSGVDPEDCGSVVSPL